MTRKEAIEYLRPIADSAVLPKYQQALSIAIKELEFGYQCEQMFALYKLRKEKKLETEK